MSLGQASYWAAENGSVFVSLTTKEPEWDKAGWPTAPTPDSGGGETYQKLDKCLSLGLLELTDDIIYGVAK